MTYIPNTPGELFKLNNGPFPENPYESERVQAALAALDPVNGGTLCDMQAVAEKLINCLRVAYELALEDDTANAELRIYANDMVTNLLAAEALVEKAHFIDMQGDQNEAGLDS